MKTAEERFWGKVVKGDGCWFWQGKIKSGPSGDYGIFLINNKYIRAHRFSWELHNGEIPDGLFICHHCDNPACVRPDHLFLGTAKDNHQDMMNKGRSYQPKGVYHPKHKLTPEQVREIRATYNPKTTSHKKMGLIYGVSANSIGEVLRGESWKHI